MTTPRSRHEVFGESEYLSPVDYGELSKAEKLVLLLGCMGVGVFMIYTYYFA